MVRAVCMDFVPVRPGPEPTTFSAMARASPSRDFREA
jgi:hypothetical protein